MQSINAKVRALLAARDVIVPGFRVRAQRVSVYAVAIGDHLGMDQESLLRLRLAAELKGVDGLEGDLQAMIATDARSMEIIGLCEAFDRLQSTDELKDFDPDLVAALKAVQPLIQPV